MASRAALLGSAAPRSEHDPDLEAAAVATIAMQLVTGTFADPTHESAFAAQFFRLAFPCHVFLIALNLAVFTWAALVTQPEMSAFWSLIGLVAAFLMLSRVLIHCIVDSVRGQRLGSQSWTALIVISWVGGVGMYMMDTTAACATAQVNYLGPLIALVTALVNGSHGMGFAHKLGLMGLLLVLDLLLVAVCFKFALAQALGDVGAHMVGFVVAHMVEMHLRQIYAENAEKVKDQRRLTEERRRLEERNEQLRAEKERLMYDVQRRGGRPLDDGDDRSAIRRGLQAGPSQPYHRADSSTGSSETGTPAQSDSPPASLPPGPPSSKSSHSSEPISIAGKSTAPPPPTLAHPSSLARGPVSELVAGQVADVLLTEVLADKEVLVELQILLHSATETSSGGRPSPEPNQGSQGPLPAQTNSSVVPSVTVAQQQRAIPHRMQDTVTVDSTLQVQRDVREMLASYSPVVPSCNVHEPPGSLGGQSNMSTGQQALHVARHRMHAASVEVEAHRAIRTLAIALGASRTEGGTIKALQAVLLQLEQPGMSCDEARTATGASMSNFMKWKRRVHQARLN